MMGVPPNVLRTTLGLVAIAWHNARASNAWLITPVHRHGPSLHRRSGKTSIVILGVARSSMPRPRLMVRCESSRWGADDRTACSVPRSWTDRTVVPPSPRRRHHRHDRSDSAGSLVVLNAAATPPRQPVTGGTFVEGDDFGSSLEDEIEAMGGDVFFLEGYGSRKTLGQASEKSDPPSSGDDPHEGLVDVDEGWDGVVDDNAHFDFD